MYVDLVLGQNYGYSDYIFCVKFSAPIEKVVQLLEAFNRLVRNSANIDWDLVLATAQKEETR